MQQCRARVLGAEKAAKNNVIGQRRRRAPDAHLDIDARERLDRGTGIEQTQRQPTQRNL